MSSGPQTAGKLQTWSLVLPGANNACKTSQPSQTKILAEGRDKFPSANKTEAGEKQCACFGKRALHKAGGPKGARPREPWYVPGFQREKISTLGNHYRLLQTRLSGVQLMKD